MIMSIDWSKMTKGYKPAVDPSTQPWVKMGPVWCPDCKSGGREVIHFAKGVHVMNGGRVIDLACEKQCDPECRYYNKDFQKEYKDESTYQSTLFYYGMILLLASFLTFTGAMVSIYLRNIFLFNIIISAICYFKATTIKK